MMDKNNRARAVADLAEGLILATVEIAAPPERVFRALTSKEVVSWWVRPGVFDTREWTGDVRVGGRWRTSGVARGEPYALEGEYLEVDPPRKLVQTWLRVGASGPPSVVTYRLDPVAGGTLVTLRHSGITPLETAGSICVGWETSFEALPKTLGGG
jgi:uncharacterized protein YndB with AHSA1/START domain